MVITHARNVNRIPQHRRRHKTLAYYGRRSLGGIFGMSRAAQVFGFAVGPLVSAVVFDSTGSYRGAFIALALVAILASALLWTARRSATTARIAQE